MHDAPTGPTLVEGRNLAYRAKLRPVDADETARELGAYAHGPNAAEAADQFVKQMARRAGLPV